MPSLSHCHGRHRQRAAASIAIDKLSVRREGASPRRHAGAASRPGSCPPESAGQAVEGAGLDVRKDVAAQLPEHAAGRRLWVCWLPPDQHPLRPAVGANLVRRMPAVQCAWQWYVLSCMPSQNVRMACLQNRVKPRAPLQ